MKRLLLLILFMVSAWVYAQESYKYWVKFSDKNGTPYDVDHPSGYLSQRALERRSRYGVAVDTLDLPVNPSYLQTIRNLGFGVRNVSKWINGVVVDVRDTFRVEELRGLPFVKNVVLYESPCQYVPVTDQFGASFAVRELYSQRYSSKWYNGGNAQIEQLNGIALHRAGYHGEGMLIGVCDAGFPGVDSIGYFKTLREDGRLVGARDFVFPGGSVYNDHPHGTMVLSTMASYDPGFYVGTAYKASYVLCKTENAYSETPLEEYYWIAAAEYLDSMGVDIITTSLGYFEFDDPSMSLGMDDLDGCTRDMSIAANIAVTRGMLVLNAAGNEGNNNPPRLNTPADAEKVLTVGAVDIRGNGTSFTSPGPTADGRIKPDVSALGQGVGVALPSGGYFVGNGTSFACPIMAGMMACLWQRFRQHTPEQLCDSVRSWGDRSHFPNNTVGYGIPDFEKALRSSPDQVNVPMTESMCISLSPNPSHGKVSLNVEDETAMVMVYDAMGKTLYAGQVMDGRVQEVLSALPRGLYLVKVVGMSGSESIKLVRD